MCEQWRQMICLRGVVMHGIHDNKTKIVLGVCVCARACVYAYVDVRLHTIVFLLLLDGAACFVNVHVTPTAAQGRGTSPWCGGETRN